MAPPSVLPDISPTCWEIGSFGASLILATLEIGESGDDGQIERGNLNLKASIGVSANRRAVRVQAHKE